MTSPIDTNSPTQSPERDSADQADEPRQPRLGIPSNDVYARVGDVVLLAAKDGVRRRLTPQNITREIMENHSVRLNVSELRILLASRRLPE
jgi:hypothetical protein